MDGMAHLSYLRDFDDEVVYRQQEEAVLSANDGSFMIQFDSTQATSVLNIDETLIEEILQVKPDKFTRWINIWGPERHKKLVKKLSAQYDFSPRLLGIMCSDHNKPAPVPAVSHHNGHIWNKLHTTPQHAAINRPTSDPEKDGTRGVPTVARDTLDISHYKVVNEVWHFCSVDWGKRYLCVGYNSLSDPAAALVAHRFPDQQDEDLDDGVRNKPKGIRVWTWLVLCDDGTVISIYETPFPDKKGDTTERDRVLLSVIRRNLHNVFMQLSKANDERRKKNPINTLDIRPGLSSNLSTGQSSKIKISDSPSLLFYYLFDDWYTTYALVAKKEHHYAARLEKLRRDLVARPDVTLIDRLHLYGRQLAVLKRMYESYALIIERILNRRKSVSSNAQQSSVNGQALQHLIPNESSLDDKDDSAENQTFRAPISSPATVRFERLLDRIKLFAVSEIQECIDEKESLVFLVRCPPKPNQSPTDISQNFNLLAMKESHAVERLTRVTILLAKVTILFMPVSIMTAYFSTQLIGLTDRYSITTYWISFAVIMTVTFILLLIFGQLSGTVEGKPIYRTLEQTAYEAVKGKWKLRRSRVKNQAL